MRSSNLAGKVSYPVNICPAVFAPRGLLNELLNKFSHLDLGCSMNFVPTVPSCCSFHTLGSFLPPWHLAFKMAAPLVKNYLNPLFQKNFIPVKNKPAKVSLTNATITDHISANHFQNNDKAFWKALLQLMF